MKKPIIFLMGMILLTASVLGVDIANDDFECGSTNCGTWLNNIWSYTGTCIATSLGNPLDTYHMRGSASCDVVRNMDTTGYGQVNVTFYATASSLEAGDFCRYYY